MHGLMPGEGAHLSGNCLIRRKKKSNLHRVNSRNFQKTFWWPHKYLQEWGSKWNNPEFLYLEDQKWGGKIWNFVENYQQGHPLFPSDRTMCTLHCWKILHNLQARVGDLKYKKWTRSPLQAQAKSAFGQDLDQGLGLICNSNYLSLNYYVQLWFNSWSDECYLHLQL